MSEAAVNLDTLFDIVRASPMLDEVEAGLRKAGKAQMADALLKLQQDAGVAIDLVMGGGTDVAPGPQTAALRQNFETVTARRVQLFRDVGAYLSDAGVKQRLSELADKMPAVGGGRKPTLGLGYIS